MTPTESRKIYSISTLEVAAISLFSSSGCIENTVPKKCLTASVEKLARIPEAIPVTIEVVIGSIVYLLVLH